MQLEMFPQSYLELQREILKDRKLQEHMMISLSAQTNAGLEEKLASIATYLNIAVHGMYDVDDLCHMLAQKLAEKNALIIITH